MVVNDRPYRAWILYGLPGLPLAMLGLPFSGMSLGVELPLGSNRTTSPAQEPLP